MQAIACHVLLWTSVLGLMTLSCMDGARVETGEDHVDPFDILNFDPAHVRMTKDPKDSQNTKEHKHPYENPRENPTDLENQRKTTKEDEQGSNKDEIPGGQKASEVGASQTCGSLTALFKQYLKQLLHLLEPLVGSVGGEHDVCLKVRVTYHDLAVFRRFANSHSLDVHDVHESLSHILQDAQKVTAAGSRVFWLEEKLGVSSASLGQISIIVSAAAFLFQALRRMNWKWLPFILFAVSAVFTWFEMFQKERANQEKVLSADISQHCPDVANLSLWGQIFYYASSTFTFQDENCRQYYEALVVNPLFIVNPLEACAVVVVKIFVTPLEVVGSGFKRLLVSLLHGLPLQHQFYLMVFLALLFLLLPFCAFGYRVRIPFLLAIEPLQRTQVQEIRHMPQGALDTDDSNVAAPSSAGRLNRGGRGGGGSVRRLVSAEESSLSERMSALSISPSETVSATDQRQENVETPVSRFTPSVPAAERSVSARSEDYCSSAVASSAGSRAGTAAVSSSENLPSSSTDVSVVDKTVAAVTSEDLLSSSTDISGTNKTAAVTTSEELSRSRTDKTGAVVTSEEPIHSSTKKAGAVITSENLSHNRTDKTAAVGPSEELPSSSSDVAVVDNTRPARSCESRTCSSLDSPTGVGVAGCVDDVDSLAGGDSVSSNMDSEKKV
ncbi:chloride channel CLIC-like protein 1 [Aplysia californica]|uniref:Chloride channel CLIC-like protein 1 n=1 Tax=Aplysia californica TaxID=6500 RepID=A0ABM0K0I0_APLCA|nr:chloride channel CLIC-like protein 1 [Aplysia californica]